MKTGCFNGKIFQATAIDNIVNNDFLKILPDWFNILVTLAGLVFVYILSKRNTIIDLYIKTALFISLYLILACICYYFGIIINILPPIAVWLAFGLPIYINKIKEYEK